MTNSKNQKSVTGLHILGELYTKNDKNLKSLAKARGYISAAIKKFKLTELGSFYYQFDEGGFTGIVSLVESHIAIHTWPEFGYLTLDVYLCNYSKDNTETCKKIFVEISDFFEPQKINKKLFRR